MDNIRFVLLFALTFVGILLYQAWQQDYGQAVSKPPEQPVATVPGPTTALPPVPIAPVVSSDLPPAMITPTVQQTVAKPASRAEFITVETDIVRAEISTRGGTLENLYLLDYPVEQEQPEVKFQLFKPKEPNFYLAQTGLVGSNKELAPSHEATFTAAATSYRLNSGQDKVQVDLLWSNADGIKVTKSFTFKRGSYVVELVQTVENKSNNPLVVSSYAQLQRSKPIETKDASFAKSYNGPVYYNLQDKYKKISFDDIAAKPQQIKSADGWIAMVQHHFVSAWIPDHSGTKTIYTNSFPGPSYAIGMYSPAVTIQPGTNHTFADRLFAGPKLQNELAAVAPGLELTVDYGWLTVIAQPIFWLLDHLHSVLHNWGWSIIFLTILLKLAFYKLSESSYRSMADLRRLAPKMQELKDRYGDDKERLNQAMMEMYKKEKINPLGGCLPVVVQIPVFIALYWVLLESVEMRQAPFALWITNLSAADPYFVLPLIMGVSMFIQQQLNPAPADPIQAKAMMGMPFIFTVFFAFFPSGLVLYWVVNNLLSIAQQWYIVRLVEGADAKKQGDGHSNTLQIVTKKRN